MKMIKVDDDVHAELKKSGLGIGQAVRKLVFKKAEPDILEQMHKRFDYLETLLDSPTDSRGTPEDFSNLSDAQKFVLEQQKIRAAQRKAAMNPEDNDQSDW